MASFGSLKNAIFERGEKTALSGACARPNVHDRRKKFMREYGKKASTSSGDHKADDKNDFDEYGPQGYTSGLHRQYFQIPFCSSSHSLSPPTLFDLSFEFRPLLPSSHGLGLNCGHHPPFSTSLSSFDLCCLPPMDLDYCNCGHHPPFSTSLSSETFVAFLPWTWTIVIL
ncbi:hypothetical protein SDJN03_26328, partial [Cucurbita argyrosperma subsp. sororia]